VKFTKLLDLFLVGDVREWGSCRERAQPRFGPLHPAGRGWPVGASRFMRCSPTSATTETRLQLVNDPWSPATDWRSVHLLLLSPSRRRCSSSLMRT